MTGARAPYNVLFLCAGNAARSQLAEAILNRLGAPRFRAFSAGVRPKSAPHPNALALLAEFGLPTAALRSKSWEEFAAPGAPELHFVFTMCDTVAGETCPVWPGRPIRAHWGAPDPSLIDTPQAWLATYRLLQSRIMVLCALPLEELDAPILRRKLADIGAM